MINFPSENVQKELRIVWRNWQTLCGQEGSLVTFCDFLSPRYHTLASSQSMSSRAMLKSELWEDPPKCETETPLTTTIDLFIHLLIFINYINANRHYNIQTSYSDNLLSNEIKLKQYFYISLVSMDTVVPKLFKYKLTYLSFSVLLFSLILPKNKNFPFLFFFLLIPKHGFPRHSFQDVTHGVCMSHSYKPKELKIPWWRLAEVHTSAATPVSPTLSVSVSDIRAVLFTPPVCSLLSWPQSTR